MTFACLGGSHSSEHFKTDFTAGEPVINTLSQGEYTLTQGFQQPYNEVLYQILNIPAGWSGVSTWIDISDDNVEDVFADWQNQLVIMASLENFYYPEMNINTIGNWNTTTGYKIKSNEDFSISLSGNQQENNSVQLIAGWNLIPVISRQPVSCQLLFQNVSEFTIVKEIAGTRIYWPAYGIETLKFLQPGKAYFAHTGVAGSMNFSGDPDYKHQTHLPTPGQIGNPWNTVQETDATHVILIPENEWKRAGLLPGDFIGAFDENDICRGATQIGQNSRNIVVSAFADDGFAEGKQGLETNERIGLRAYSDKEFCMNTTFDASMPDQDLFARHGISMVKSLETETTGDSFVATVAEVIIYPNPSEGKINIHIEPAPERISITVFDAFGRIVFTSRNCEINNHSFPVDLTKLPAGVYVSYLEFASHRIAAQLLIR